jgi:hypothetical protein
MILFLFKQVISNPVASELILPTACDTARRRVPKINLGRETARRRVLYIIPVPPETIGADRGENFKKSPQLLNASSLRLLAGRRVDRR